MNIIWLFFRISYHLEPVWNSTNLNDPMFLMC